MAQNKSTPFDIKKYVKKLGQDVVVQKVGHVIDVFFGNSGWTPHARFVLKRTQKGMFLSQVSGDKVPASVFKTVITKVNG